MAAHNPPADRRGSGEPKTNLSVWRLEAALPGDARPSRQRDGEPGPGLAVDQSFAGGAGTERRSAHGARAGVSTRGESGGSNRDLSQISREVFKVAPDGRGASSSRSRPSG